MLNKWSAGIDSTMGSVEDEMLLAVNMNGQDIDDFDDELEGDNDDVILDNNNLPNMDFDLDVDNENVPNEINNYINSIQSQTMRFERELEECDELLSFNPGNSKPYSENTVMVHSDFPELQEAAAEAGMTVEEFRAKLLKDIDEDDFDEETMDSEYKEISALQMELEEARLEVKKLNEGIEEEVMSFLDERDKKLQGLPLAIKDDDSASPAEADETNEEKTHKNEEIEASSLSQEPSLPVVVDNLGEAGPVAIATEFTDFRVFIRTQLKKTDAKADEHRKQLRMMFEAQRQGEEQKLLKDEEYKRHFQLEQEKEAENLLAKKMEDEKRIDNEIKNDEKVMEEEYKTYQANMEHLNAVYEEEKHRFEKSKQVIMKELSERQYKAARNIQRVFRGYRTRVLMAAAIQDLKELKELRRNEKEKLRVMEVQYEMDLKAEQAKKTKEEKEKEEEEQRKNETELKEQEELDKKKKEEADRIAEETRKEEEKKREEAKQEEERRRKEEELAKKEEEKKRKEEEKQRKEEEKKKKEEEKRQKKEEEKRKREEEKKKKEEEKKLREGEERKKKEEEKKRKEEEKRKREEEKRQDEEKKKEISIEELRKKGEDVDSETKVLEGGSREEENRMKNVSMVDDLTDKHTSNDENNEQNEMRVKGQEELEKNSTPKLSLSPNSNPTTDDDSKEKAPVLPKTLGTLSPHPPSHSPTPKTQDSVSVTPRHRAISTRISTEKAQESVLDLSAVCKSSLSSQELGQLSDMVEKPKEPNPTEKLRLNWMKSCVPWSKVSNEPWKLNQTTTAKVTKRPVSAKKKLAPIPDSVVLAAAHAESLRQVSSIEVTDLPGYSLSTLSQCWNLRYLTITQSHLICLDGLASCRHLLYINATENDIEYLDLKDLGSLQYLNVSHNKLGSIHGLQGCINLRWLDLSHNNIRKIADLSFLRRLHTLRLSHNQITNCDGVNEAVTLQDLDLSHNFLQAFDGVNRLCLLTSINLASNNLLQPPVLKNQVLLQWLYLQENSLQSLAPLGQYWLPLLHHLQVESNRLETLHGLDGFISLFTLNVSHNQLPDVESLKCCLQSCLGLQSLAVLGNPFVDVQDSEYRDLIPDAANNLKFLDGESVGEKRPASKPVDNDLCMVTYLQQISMHNELKEEFDTHTKRESSNLTPSSEVLCSATFHYCDTSFKMAVEHRSSHEYGDIHSSTSSLSSPLPSSSMKPAVVSNNSVLHLPISDRNHQDDVKRTNVSSTNSSQNEVLSKSKSKFDDVLMSHGESLNSHRSSNSHEQKNGGRELGLLNSNSSSKSKDFKVAASQSQHLQDSLNKPVVSHNSTAGKYGHKSSANYGGDGEDKDDDNDDDLFDVTKDDSDGSYAGNKPSLAKLTLLSHQPTPPGPGPGQSYMNEKDKFLMALQGGNATQTQKHSENQFNRSSHASHPAANNQDDLSRGMPVRVENGNVGSAQRSKDLFDAALGGEIRGLNPSSGQGLSSGVKANVVGAYMDHDGQGSQGVCDPDFDVMMADGFDIDELDFDFDKYLDVAELDEFLEKGWRPGESPQIPCSNYPVLGKINHHHHQDQKNHNGPPYSEHRSINYPGYDMTLTKNPTPPPSNPQHAWRDEYNNSNNNNNLARQHLFSPSKGPDIGIPPLPNPSPSPSTVASAAETLGGGSVKSKKKDELCEEWGFKDSHTAELMMARARKMKYNSERKKKLSKLNPQQRYQLFQKLEESGKIQHARPRPAKVLPRKEYFQAREQEVQRQDFERRLEEKTRVNRTFEWLHTQVGDHPISSSRINPVPAPIYSKQEMTSGQYGHVTNQRQISPSSDQDTASRLKDNYTPFTERRYSVGDASNHTRSPMLPPIAITSAPSQHRKEKLSFRNEPVELSDSSQHGQPQHSGVQRSGDAWAKS